MSSKKRTGKKMMKTVNFSVSVLATLLIVIVLYTLGHTAYSFGYRVFTEPAMTSADAAIDKVVQISSDMSPKDIGNMLEDKGLIRSSTLFILQLKLSSYSGKIKPGIYTLNTGMTARDMMKVMSADSADSTETEGSQS